MGWYFTCNFKRFILALNNQIKSVFTKKRILWEFLGNFLTFWPCGIIPSHTWRNKSSVHIIPFSVGYTYIFVLNPCICTWNRIKYWQICSNSNMWIWYIIKYWYFLYVLGMLPGFISPLVVWHDCSVYLLTCERLCKWHLCLVVIAIIELIRRRNTQNQIFAPWMGKFLLTFDVFPGFPQSLKSPWILGFPWKVLENVFVLEKSLNLGDLPWNFNW